MKLNRNIFPKVVIPAAVLALAIAACSGSSADTDADPVDTLETPQSEAPAEPDADSGDTTTDDSATDDSTSDDTASSNNVNATTTEHGVDLATTQFAITWTDAASAAMQNFSGGLTDVELDWDRTRYAYKVTLVSNSEEYEIRVDADTGEQYDEELENLDSDDAREAEQEVIDIEAIISLEDAIATALDTVSGTVTEWTLEGNDDRAPHFSIDIATADRGDVEVEIDALSGDLLKLDS